MAIVIKSIFLMFYNGVHKGDPKLSDGQIAYTKSFMNTYKRLVNNYDKTCKHLCNTYYTAV